ncbi:MAG: hypothetical protein COV41_01865 [Candidatus Brennerbacteria bacterium CG11_big_fil_rev_8_21_14_0_20_43_10]|uniref:Uncharacterized protein n=1 Tax=Candidatus Brennerbacteria bacterium CG11_big_fil_rev_8_21_14_0_20_43_10 TaxID=1974523 RepID=A0A2H0PW48_9BACT|nr:MAG: hypothetical protein COV41_01865 [Candidatus Brennerbacteria bacterium CG11_big_fil_rev_8_21_14_0_20_43_10]PJA19388.1 MAG: hypothetical protein COX61_01390 [Candidatus Brennerbacteria bacterium CG_4_10_14_0_2_um_filter_43_14]
MAGLFKAGQLAYIQLFSNSRACTSVAFLPTEDLSYAEAKDGKKSIACGTFQHSQECGNVLF